MKNKKEIRELFEQIEEKASDGDYIYRGEPAYYDKISSNLYRQYEESFKEEELDIDIEIVQKQILEEAGKYVPSKKDFEIMSEVQHYGGKSNLIDFTISYHIALFFACSSFSNRDGRIILQNKREVKDPIGKPYTPQNRVIAQKSIFIRPSKGYIEVEDKYIVKVHAYLKKDLLAYLEKYNDISDSVIFKDLHGFIRFQEIRYRNYIELYKGLMYFNKGKDK